MICYYSAAKNAKLREIFPVAFSFLRVPSRFFSTQFPYILTDKGIGSRNFAHEARQIHDLIQIDQFSSQMSRLTV